MSTLDQPQTVSQVPATTIFDSAAQGMKAGVPVIGDFQKALVLAASEWLKTQPNMPAYIPYGCILNGVSAVIRNLNYTFRKADETPLALAEVQYRNDTDVCQQFTWQDTRTTRTTVEVSVTRGLEVGVDASFGIPKIGLGIGVEVEASLSTTLSQSLITEQTWGWSMPVTVQPQTLVTAQAALKRAKYDAEFTADVRIDGGPKSCGILVTMLGSDKVVVLRNSPGGWFSLSPVEGYTPDGTAVVYRVEGRILDVQGTSVDITVTEQPIDGAGEPTRSYEIANAHAQPREEELEAFRG